MLKEWDQSSARVRVMANIPGGLSYKHHPNVMVATPLLLSLSLRNKVHWSHPKKSVFGDSQ